MCLKATFVGLCLQNALGKGGYCTVGVEIGKGPELTNQQCLTGIAYLKASIMLGQWWCYSLEKKESV